VLTAVGLSPDLLGKLDQLGDDLRGRELLIGVAVHQLADALGECTVWVVEGAAQVLEIAQLSCRLRTMTGSNRDRRSRPSGPSSSSE
jgi:hypothetical protein